MLKWLGGKVQKNGFRSTEFPVFSLNFDETSISIRLSQKKMKKFSCFSSFFMTSGGNCILDCFSSDFINLLTSKITGKYGKHQGKQENTGKQENM